MPKSSLRERTIEDCAKLGLRNSSKTLNFCVTFQVFGEYSSILTVHVCFFFFRLAAHDW